MKVKIIYSVLKIILGIFLLSFCAFQSKAEVMLDTTSLEWNQEVNKCVNLLNGAIERNKNIEDSISADNHFNFNRVNTTFDAEGNAKTSENVVSYQYVTDKNSFNFITEQTKKDLNGKLKALQDNAGVTYYILFHPSYYFMTIADAAIFNNKVFGRAKIGKAGEDKGVLIIVSVNQTISYSLHWANPYYVPTPVVLTSTSTNCVVSLSTGAGVNPEVKNEFTNILNSVFRNTYNESQREQKFLNVFDAVYRKIKFSRKVYAYQVDKRGNINEELFTLPAAMGNNEAATFSLHVQYPYYETGHTNDTKYYKQPNPIREEYIKQYARPYVVFCAYSNFKGLYNTTFIIEPPSIIYKDAYQRHIDWSLVIDLVGLQASCLGLDIVTDFVGAVYSASQGKWIDASIYTGAMFIPFVSGTVIKIFLAAGKTFSKGASFLIRKTATITNEVSADIWKFYTTSAKTKVFAEINTNGDLIIKEFSTVNFTGSTDDIVRSANYTNPTGQIETGDIAFTNVSGTSGVTKNVVKATVSFTEGLVNGVRRYNIGLEFANGKTIVIREISLNGKTISLKWTKKADGIIDFGNRSDLAKLLGTTDDEAHHILTWTKSGMHRIVQAAAEDGFHLNTFENGIGLSKYVKTLNEGLHGNHPSYDDYVVHRLTQYSNSFPKYTPESANEFIQKILIPDMKDLIEAASKSNLNLNEYFKQVINPSVGPLLK